MHYNSTTSEATTNNNLIAQLVRALFGEASPLLLVFAGAGVGHCGGVAVVLGDVVTVAGLVVGGVLVVLAGPGTVNPIPSSPLIKIPIPPVADSFPDPPDAAESVMSPTLVQNPSTAAMSEYADGAAVDT
jgi:hypothetical protein